MAPPAALRSSDVPIISTSSSPEKTKNKRGSEKAKKRAWPKRRAQIAASEERRAKIAKYDAAHSLRSNQVPQAQSPEAEEAGAQVSQAHSPSHLGKRKRQKPAGGSGKKQRQQQQRSAGEGGAAGHGSAQNIAPLESPAGSKSPMLHCSKAPRKTSQVTVNAMGGTQLHVIVTNEASVVDQWIRQHAREGAALRVPPSATAGAGRRSEEASSFLLGMDAEWKPTYRRGEESPVALLQLSTATHCLLVQMLFLDRTPASLRKLLRAEDVVLGGVGVKQDALKVQEHHGLASRPEGLLEIEHLAKMAGLASATPSLKSFCQAVLGEPLEKNKKVTMSNWAAYKLTDRQVQYGALDAWVSFEIVRRLMHDIPASEGEEEA